MWAFRDGCDFSIGSQCNECLNKYYLKHWESLISKDNVRKACKVEVKSSNSKDISWDDCVSGF